jgi:hypothetical protein
MSTPVYLFTKTNKNIKSNIERMKTLMSSPDTKKSKMKQRKKNEK